MVLVTDRLIGGIAAPAQYGHPAELCLFAPTSTGTWSGGHAGDNSQFFCHHMHTLPSYVGDHDGPIIQGPYCLAKSDRVDARDLQAHRVLSTVGAVWADGPVASCGGLGRLELRSGDPAGHCCFSRIWVGAESRNWGEALRGCESSASRPDAVAALQSLRRIVSLSLLDTDYVDSSPTAACLSSQLSVNISVPYVPVSLSSLLVPDWRLGGYQIPRGYRRERRPTLADKLPFSIDSPAKNTNRCGFLNLVLSAIQLKVEIDSRLRTASTSPRRPMHSSGGAIC